MALHEEQTRKAPTMVAAAVAMAASMSVMAAVVVADIAEARATEPVEQLDDALTPASPVTMRKLKFEAPIPLDAFDDDEVRPTKRKGIRFGRFEGY
ncbi:MAG: hypothetical protein Q8N26_31935 [Myxococcales bacterium]|nr:hypothetical protein [Myxococcales bacterium]